MKNIIAIVVGLAVGTSAVWAQTGNGAMSGAHYNLNILGKKTCSPEPLTDSNRHNIQVLLNGGDSAGGLKGQLASAISKQNKIYLTAGEFLVLDGNACDGDGAKFQLPAGGYVVFARALGKPGGKSTMTTCATSAGADGVLGTADDEILCSTESMVLAREKGKSSFSNVTAQLTTIVIDTDGDGIGDTTTSLFDPTLQDYMWNYDNQGLRLAQLRFYQVTK